MKQKLFILDGAPQTTLERQTPRRQVVNVSGEELVVCSARFLRLVERGASVLQQRVRILAVQWKQTDADTRGRKQLVTRLIERKLQHLRQRADGFNHVCGSVDLCAQ